MQAQTMFAALSALATFVNANPIAASETVTPATVTNVCGALDTNCRRPAPTGIQAQAAAAGAGMTISIINRASLALTTAHTVGTAANGKPYPTATSGNVGPGTLAPGATGAFAVPTGWAGTVFLGTVQAGELNRDAGSIIEGSFMPNGGGAAVEDIDVSYVTGFSVPITCSCAAAGRVVTGCNKPLFQLHQCANPAPGGVCANPQRNNVSPNARASPFFEPCQGDAYTYPNDGAANSYDQCGNSPIVCCVGPNCPAHP